MEDWFLEVPPGPEWPPDVLCEFSRPADPENTDGGAVEGLAFLTGQGSCTNSRGKRYTEETVVYCALNIITESKVTTLQWTTSAFEERLCL